jgi:hypothetical protein
MHPAMAAPKCASKQPVPAVRTRRRQQHAARRGGSSWLDRVPSPPARTLRLSYVPFVARRGTAPPLSESCGGILQLATTYGEAPSRNHRLPRVVGSGQQDEDERLLTAREGDRMRPPGANMPQINLSADA